MLTWTEDSRLNDLGLKTARHQGHQTTTNRVAKAEQTGSERATTSGFRWGGPPPTAQSEPAPGQRPVRGRIGDTEENRKGGRDATHTDWFDTSGASEHSEILSTHTHTHSHLLGPPRPTSTGRACPTPPPAPVKMRQKSRDQ
jgi:hypothetical protein